MGDEEAFLQVIAAAPADDAPRLVYADWLDERDDPRGAYLRAVTLAASRVRIGLPWDDLRAAVRAARVAAPAEWRDRVGPWFEVVLEDVRPERKISTVKAIRAATPRGLAEAKAVLDAVLDGSPTVVAHRLTLDQAEGLRERLEAEPWPAAPGPSRVPQCRTSLRLHA